MTAIISSNRRRIAKNELIDVVKEIGFHGNLQIDITYIEAQIESAVDLICDAVHEEVRGWLRAEGIIE